MFEIEIVNGEFRIVNTMTGDVRFTTNSAQTAHAMRRLFASFFIEEAEFEAWWKDLCNGQLTDGALKIYPGPYRIAAKEAWLQRATRDKHSLIHT